MEVRNEQKEMEIKRRMAEPQSFHRPGSLGLSDLSKRIVRLPYTAALFLKERTRILA
jgi:hypothetical protein